MDDQCFCGNNNLTILEMVKQDMSCGIPTDQCGQCFFTAANTGARRKHCPKGILIPAIERQLVSNCSCSLICDSNSNATIQVNNCWQNDADSIDTRGCLNRQKVPFHHQVSVLIYLKSTFKDLIFSPFRKKHGSWEEKMQKKPQKGWCGKNDVLVKRTYHTSVRTIWESFTKTATKTFPSFATWLLGPLKMHGVGVIRVPM